jgi:hypothetical protein
MKKLPAIIYLLLFVNFNSIAQADEKIYNTAFDVKDVPLFNNILKPDKIDSQMYHLRVYPEGVFSQKAFKRYKSFYDNRCKIYLQDTLANKQNNPDDSIIAWRPFCNCQILNDTIFVIMSNGLMMDSYTACLIKIYKDKFNFQYSAFYMPGDWGVRFLSKENDTDYTPSLNPTTKYQYLVLKKKPSYRPNQQLTGYLSCTINTYIEKSIYEEIKRHSISGRLFFTCKTKRMHLKKD